MKSMVIGLGPEYNYPGNLAKWQAHNTRFASNHGASLISRAISKQFDADYVDDFSDIPGLRNRYDCCILALASHVSTRRDVSYFADIVESLDIRTVAFSLGVQDYAMSSTAIPTVHPSVERLLRAVDERSEFIGVRGHYSAIVLSKLGFSDVVPVGCPTVFWNMQPELNIRKGRNFRHPLIAYHRTLAAANWKLLDGALILGQDFLDEAMLTDNLIHDQVLWKMERDAYLEYDHSDRIFELLRSGSSFPRNFSEWFAAIGRSDFVFGPRLHGCIAALVQGIPAVLLTRDLRTEEMAQMFSIPSFAYDDLKYKTAEDLFESADFTDFSATYGRRYNNYLKFLGENKLKSNLETAGLGVDYSFSFNDLKVVEKLGFNT